MGTLVLTHDVPALVPGEESVWRDLAAEHFGGTVEVWPDLHAVTV